MHLKRTMRISVPSYALILRGPGVMTWPRPAAARTPGTGALAAGSRRRVREGGGEREHLADAILAVGRLAEPQRQVIGGDRAHVAMVGFAVLVAAVRGL